MKVGQLALRQLQSQLATEGVCLRIGPFVARLSSPLPAAAELVYQLYTDYDLVDFPNFIDFRLRLVPARGLARFLRDRVRLIVDGEQWCRCPPSIAPAYLEWGINWCIFRGAHHLLVVHAAVVAREGKALIMPAESSSGKSTLAAALMHSGWRLLSDELALVCPESGLVVAATKPVCLKNESIAALQRFAPEAEFGPVLADPDNQLQVAHVRPKPSCVAASDQSAAPRLIVFPQFVAGAGTSLEPLTPAAGFMKLAQGCFNYMLLGGAGFNLVGRMIEQCACYDLTFGDLAAAVDAIDGIELGRTLAAEAQLAR